MLAESSNPGLWVAALAVGLGSALGALLRWQLGVWLNPLWEAAPPGTLAVNLIGGFGVGVAVAFFAQQPQLSPAWRLFVITGFLGGLTTFSAFSAEVVALLQQGRPLLSLGLAFAHVAGSLAATWAGLCAYQALRPQ